MPEILARDCTALMSSLLLNSLDHWRDVQPEFFDKNDLLFTSNLCEQRRPRAADVGGKLKHECAFV